MNGEEVQKQNGNKLFPWRVHKKNDRRSLKLPAAGKAPENGLIPSCANMICA
jgi:hypothetical protein